MPFTIDFLVAPSFKKILPEKKISLNEELQKNEEFWKKKSQTFNKLQKTSLKNYTT